MLEILKDFIADRKIWIYGFGVEGKSTFQFLKSFGFDISIVDGGDVGIIDGANQVICGKDLEEFWPQLDECHIVFRSAGISPLKPELKLLSAQGVHISSQLELFSLLRKKPTIAVTGTMGKGTTCTLLRHMMMSQGLTCEIGGNYGLAMLDLLQSQEDLDFLILELSSFQLMDFKGAFDYSILLRTTSEHLDWHLSQSEYVWAKSNLVQDVSQEQKVVFFADSENCLEMIQSTRGELMPYGSQESIKNLQSRSLEFNLRRAISFIDTEKFKMTFLNGSLKSQEVDFDLRTTPILGAHQLQNIGAASLICADLGLDMAKVWQSLKEYQGPKMRMQKVGESQGVQFINDSYATRPDATIAAISAIQAEPLALILGGSEKNADFNELASELKAHPSLIGVYLIGQTASRLKQIILDYGVETSISEHKGFEDALNTAQQDLNKHPRGTLLMSPACASFGMFKNYVDRGEKFNSWVRDQLKS